VLAGEIASETDGNPFFVGEVLRSLVESGRLPYDPATERWSVDRSAPLGLPESVRDSIARRVDRLGDEAREVLTLAAVIGRSFELELLVRLMDTTESVLLDRLEAAVGASLLDESTERVGRFRFVHALINQTLYEGLGATRRSSMHHRVRSRSKSCTGRIRASTSRSWRCTGGWPRSTGRRPLTTRRGQGGARSTASRRRRRRSCSPTRSICSAPSTTRNAAGALIGLGEAQQLTGDPAYRTTLLHAAQIASTLGDADLAAAAALANTRGFTSLIGHLDHERVEAIEGALALDERADPGRRAQLLALDAGIRRELPALSPERRYRRADRSVGPAPGPAPHTGTIGGMTTFFFTFAYSPPYASLIPAGGVNLDPWFSSPKCNAALITFRGQIRNFVDEHINNRAEELARIRGGPGSIPGYASNQYGQWPSSIEI